MLAKDSPYFVVSSSSGYSNDKPKLVRGVSGAIILYFISMIFSGYLWLRPNKIEEIVDPRFLD
jgi:hypothetical protein